MKSKVYFIVALIIIICFSVITIKQVNEYKRRNLNKALSFEELGEYDKAREHYKEYILKNENDYLAKIKYCKLLTKMNEFELAITVLKNILQNLKDEDLKITVSNNLITNHYLLIEAYKDSSEIWSSKGNHEKSRYYWEKEFDSRYERRFFHYDWDTSSTAKSFSMYLLYEVLVTLKTKIALSYWTEDLITQAEKVLDEYEGNINLDIGDYEKWTKRKWKSYASALFDSASIEFDNGKYSRAKDILELRYYSV